MDFSYTRQEQVIRETARKLLSKKCPSALVRAMEEDEKGFSPDLWHDMAELGWLGFMFPDEYDGFGGSFFELVVLLEEIGRYLAPVPFLPTVILGGLPILEGGREAQKRELLPGIAHGDLILTLALSEADGSYDAAGVRLTAGREGDGFVLDGTKLFVPYAHVADYLLCAARTERGAGRDEGITLFLVKGDHPGVRATVLDTIDHEKQCEVIFDHVMVDKTAMLGAYNDGWPIIKKALEHARVAQCALMVGGAEKVLEMSVDHVKVREQFGRPVGAFQAVQHRCANMKVDLEASRLLTYEAAWRLSRGLPATLEASAAKAWLNQAYNRICDNGHQVHGGDGVMNEQDIQLYSRRAWGGAPFLGETRFHREIVAAQLGL